MKPMLARTYGPKYNLFPAYLQPKFNGVRCLAQSGKFQSRDEILWHPSKVEHIQFWLDKHGDLINELTLDGELYRHGWKLQRINRAMAVKSAKVTPDTNEIVYVVFDIVDHAAPFEERFLPFFERLRERHEPSTRIAVAPTHLVYFREQVDEYLREYVNMGFEGVMLRPQNKPYVYGVTDHATECRSDALWKYKHWEDAEFLCVGVTQGEGKAEIGVGALICQTSTGAIFNVGTGFDDDDRIELMQDKPIGKMIKVRFNGLTQDGIPQPASFLQVLY